MDIAGFQYQFIYKNTGKAVWPMGLGWLTPGLSLIIFVSITESSVLSILTMMIDSLILRLISSFFYLWILMIFG